MSAELGMCIASMGESIPTINNNYITAQIEGKTKELTYTCNLCKISATSQKVLLRHYEGRKHKIRVEREGKTFVCEICQVTANSQKQLDNHLKSARYKYQLEKKRLSRMPEVKWESGVWLILLGITCMFINFLIIFKICL